MMTPHMAEDITVLKQYLAPHTNDRAPINKDYSHISNARGHPIVYLTVPRERKGFNSAVVPGKVQREIVEQILSPFVEDVKSLFFEHLHPCFPVLDELTFQEMWQKNKESISSTLLCDIYANALQFWSCSDKLRKYARPDVHFIWNQSVAALQDDFMAPTISTIHSALLDLIGRPVIQVNGNIVNTGRIVTLAQSLGLHRNPCSWTITSYEKSVRIRLWWGVLIHDYWSSISHGIPPMINPDYYDVPLPLPGHISDPTRAKSEASFIQLCKLSAILGKVLPSVYGLKPDFGILSRSLRRIDCELDDWVTELPDYLQSRSFAIIASNGASNLWFCFLSVRMLVCRLTYKITLKEPGSISVEAHQYRLANMREASYNLIDFITSLTETHLREFWLPYTSYLLVAATTILLRCTIECGNIDTKKLCVLKLLDFSARLRDADEKGWDLADFCLERCSEPIQKMAEALKISRVSTQGIATDPVATNIVTAHTGRSDQVETDGIEHGSGAIFDFELPLDSVDYPWETLWTTLEGPWSTHI
ncbi:hypothetical protein T440DRAFT_414603 [Plenodomus tracheiphilus IPT5]|uniref:Xylanolytic transcriptional activator regulatory domain-containing protein n=1 Tax=Plenodomus tracheiphilus IPT5 TaxID=1408161 RepID=A0A6A7BK19_9PLEO|nr:hypothetical protein T440DRAFT_414603 [Plenodomus tracheiphilus IPT5]